MLSMPALFVIFPRLRSPRPSAPRAPGMPPARRGVRLPLTMRCGGHSLREDVCRAKPRQRAKRGRQAMSPTRPSARLTRPPHCTSALRVAGDVGQTRCTASPRRRRECARPSAPPRRRALLFFDTYAVTTRGRRPRRFRGTKRGPRHPSTDRSGSERRNRVTGCVYPGTADHGLVLP